MPTIHVIYDPRDKIKTGIPSDEAKRIGASAVSMTLEAEIDDKTDIGLRLPVNAGRMIAVCELWKRQAPTGDQSK